MENVGISIRLWTSRVYYRLEVFTTRKSNCRAWRREIHPQVEQCPAMWNKNINNDEDAGRMLETQLVEWKHQNSTNCIHAFMLVFMVSGPSPPSLGLTNGLDWVGRTSPTRTKIFSFCSHLAGHVDGMLMYLMYQDQGEWDRRKVSLRIGRYLIQAKIDNFLKVVKASQNKKWNILKTVTYHFWFNALPLHMTFAGLGIGC